MDVYSLPSLVLDTRFPAGMTRIFNLLNYPTYQDNT